MSALIHSPSHFTNPLDPRGLLGSFRRGGGAVTWPLDDYTAGGVAFFSTRKLLTTLAYADPVRLRESGTTESDIPFASDGLDVDATTRDAFISTGDAQLVTWYDQLNGNDANESTVAKQPYAQLSATPISLNGRQAFSGSGIGAVRRDISTASFAHGIGTGDFMVSIITEHTAGASTYNALLAFGTYAPAFYTLFASVAKPSLYIGGAQKTFDTTLTTGVPCVITFTRESGTLKCYLNGVQEATTFANSTDIPTSTITLLNEETPSGGSSSPNPTQEILILSSVANRAAIIASQMAHLGL